MSNKKRKKPVMGRMPQELFAKLTTGTGIGAHKGRKGIPDRERKYKQKWADAE